MNKVIALSVLSTLAWMFSTAGVFATQYISDGFEGHPAGVTPSGLGWTANGTVIVTNNALAHSGTNSLFIPILTSVTNSTVSSDLRTNVWTDFYTIPRRYVSDTGIAPVTDPNATAQFFVNSNGMWVTISGNGTNECRQSLAPGLVYPTVTQYAVYYHVSVLHNYAAANWSLFVNDIPIATNLAFLASASGVTNHQWVQVQNLGGNSTNSCWLDDFLVYGAGTKPPSSGANALTNTVPRTTLPIYDALIAFGTVSDPRPTNKTIAVVGSGVALGFGRVLPGTTYAVYGTPNYDLSGLANKGALAGNSFTDSVSLASSTREYYKLVTVSADGSIALTNDETYASYKQYRYGNQYSVVGVPVQATDRTMGGELGMQLAAGLANNDVVQLTENGTAYRYVVFNHNMNCILGPDPGATNKQWGLGVGMAVLPTNSSSFTYIAGIKATNAVSITVSNGYWGYLSWVHADKTFSGNGSNVLGFVASTNDYIYIQTNGSASFLAAKFDGAVWKTLIRPWPALSNITIKAGDGIVYKPLGGDKVFSSVGP